jgi:hypothetical protein
MTTITVELLRDDAWDLIRQLERLAILRIHKPKKVPLNGADTTAYEPKTVAHFLAVSQTLTAWTEADATAIEDIHNQINQHEPPTW